MRRTIVLLLFVAATAGSAAASPMGGTAADLLYANSIYGISHPLPVYVLSPYALSPAEIKRHRRTDTAVGVLGNMLLPGLGSTLIGDREGIWAAIGYWASVSVALVAATLAGLLSFDNPNPPNLLPLAITTEISLGAAGIFYVWGVVVPIHYVRHKRYSD